MLRKLIIVLLYSMTLVTTEKSMHITRISQTHTGAPFMTPSILIPFLSNSGTYNFNYRDGLPKRNLELDTENNKQRYGYLDPYVNVTGKPFQPRVNNWTYVFSENSYQIPVISDTGRSFRIGMNQILQTMGKLQGIQVVHIKQNKTEIESCI